MQNTLGTVNMQMATVGQPQPKIRKMKSIYNTGVLQIIGGTILILCGFVLVCTRYYIYYRNNFDNSICGIWGGTMVLITGIIGVLGSYRRRWLIAYLVCSLVSLVFLVVVTIIGAVAAADNVHYWKEHAGYHHYDDPDYPDQHGISITKLAFHLVLCVVGSLELVVCVLAAVFCCTGICPGDASPTAVTYQAAPMPATGGVPPGNFYQPPYYAYPPPPVEVKQPQESA